MFTNDELIGKYIVYTPEITEEIFNNITKDFGTYGTYCDYKGFKKHGFLGFFKRDNKNVIQTMASSSNLNKISYKDIIGEKKPKFEVGKWYRDERWDKGSYAKFLKWENENMFFFSERIRDGYSNYEDWWKVFPNADIKEVSIEEIQQYLPKGHPDKIKSFQVHDKCNIGDIIVSLEPQSSIVTSRKNGDLFKVLEKSTKEYLYYTSRNSISKENSHTYRLATSQEINMYNNGVKNIYDMKEEPEYFDDLSQHIGRYIKALVDGPNAGRIKKGEIGLIINSYYADFPSQKGYACGKALSKVNKNRYELMPEFYSPEEKDDSLEEVKKDNMEELLEEAKRRYPIGTKFKVVHRPDVIATVISHNKYESTFVNDGMKIHINFLCEKLSDSDSKGASVYCNGKWAEIISDKSDLKEQETVLDKWLRETKAKNLSLKDLAKKVNSSDFIEIYSKLEGSFSSDKAKILFDKWNSYKVPDNLSFWTDRAVKVGYDIGIDPNKPELILNDDDEEIMLPSIKREKITKTKLLID